MAEFEIGLEPDYEDEEPVFLESILNYIYRYISQAIKEKKQKELRESGLCKHKTIKWGICQVCGMDTADFMKWVKYYSAKDLARLEREEMRNDKRSGNAWWDCQI